MKKPRQILCLVLLLCLLAGCAPSASASVAQGSSISSSAQSDAPAIPSWQRAFYRAVREQLNQEDAAALTDISFLYSPSGPPIMLLWAHAPEDSRVSIWKIQDDAAVMTSAYVGYPFGVRYETGMPVYTEDESDENGNRQLLVYEQNGKQKNYLYRYTFTEDYQRILYTYADDKTWAWEEEQEQNPVGQFQIIEMNSYTNDLTLSLPEDSIQKREMLKEFFLQAYQPPVPQQAPAWVADYVRFLRINLNAWEPDTQVNLQHTLWQKGITLLKPLWENGPPLLWGMWESEIYYCLFEDGMHSFGAMFENSHQFYHDAEGNTLIEFNSGGSGDYSAYWYGVNSSGTTYLFYEGGAVWEGEHGSRYVYNKRIYFASDEERDENNNDAWGNKKRNEVFAEFGYKPPLTRYTKTYYTMPQNATTWAELEGEIITALCAYARQLGQWG